MLDDGLFFDLDEAWYHAEPRLSNSGIKWLMVSTLDFWIRSWLNPNRPEDEDTEPKRIGKAYHRRIVEGRALFEKSYAPKLDISDYGHVLRTSEEIKAALQDKDLPRTGNKAQLIKRLREADPSVPLWSSIEAAYKESNAGKEFLDRDLMDRIEIAAAMVEKHPTVSKCFQGGYPEVSILWTDEETGVKMKARLDYLKAQAIIDLKTYSNVYDRPIDRAISTAMANGRYHIQAAIYSHAVERAKEMVHDGKIVCCQNDVDDRWLKQFVNHPHAESEPHTFVFVFQQQGIAPVARAKIMPREMTTMDIGWRVAQEQMQIFAQCQKKFGADPWIDETPIESFDDESFPNYMTEM
ncbi:MAG: hypothetical protein GY906_24150 [bacterium]|nr:hypothetical protein [bacterium]